jgi:hypothetical protein
MLIAFVLGIGSGYQSGFEIIRLSPYTLEFLAGLGLFMVRAIIQIIA